MIKGGDKTTLRIRGIPRRVLSANQPRPLGPVIVVIAARPKPSDHPADAWVRVRDAVWQAAQTRQREEQR